MSLPDQVVLRLQDAYGRLTWFTRLLPWLAGAGMLAVIPGVVRRTQGDLMQLLLLLGLAFPMILLLTLGSHLLQQSRQRAELVLSASGIRHQTLFYTLETHWDNVARLTVLSSARGPLGTPVLGLSLKKPGQITDRFLLGASASELMRIPLSPFGDLEQPGVLRSALTAWAPHLLDKSPQEA
ncbi:MAG: hypothetical protein IGS03_11815 [Candidatus Sericytochromatia bacterium]|nr:hypothetical protein [Candidatus Sericytochromatia bacterium]